MSYPTSCAVFRLHAAARAAALAALVLAGAAQAQPGRTFIAGSGPDELWDITTKMEMSGMPMAIPGQTHQVCLRKDRKAEDAIPKQSDCRVYDVRTSGNTVSYRMECTGKNPMTGEGEVTSTPSSYSGRMKMRSTKKGEEMDFTQTFSGKRAGACTDQSQQMVAAAKAQGDAATARVCSEGMDKLVTQYFFGAGAPCASQQKAFCDKVGGYARDMREPAGFKTVAAKVGSGALRPAFDACNQSFEATSRAACGKASSSKDWSFVGGGNCDPEVLSVGGTQCRGRDYYTMDRGLAPLCNRYAMLTRGAGASAASTPPAKSASSAPAPEQKADPVKQGLDAIRKSLPF